MAPQHDLEKPMDDPYSLVGDSWPSESENSYHTAKVAAEDASTTASVLSESATDAGSKMGDEHGKTADAVSSGYSAAARQLSEQSRNFTTISAWMEDAAVKVLDAKRHIRHLVRTATSEIKDAITSETEGRPANPSSSELITKYRDEIKSVARTLTTDLDAIGHSLAGDPGASRTPSYISVSTASTPEHADPHVVAASYTGDHHAPELATHELPPMPRAVTAPTAESPSGAGAPSTPASSAPHPTLAHLIGGQGGTPSAGTTSAASPGGTSATHTPTSPSTQSTQSHQPTEQRQTPKPAGLPHIPSLPLDGLPAAAAESVATVVSSATAHQLSTAAPSTSTPPVPMSTGITPGVSGTPPMTPVTPVTPAPLAPIGGGGGLSTPAVTQPATPVTPAAPPAASQQTTPSPTRGAVVDAAWIQQRYGLAPGLDLPKSETTPVPALFVTNLPENEAHLHRVLGTLRQTFESSGWSQPLAVATIRRGFEHRTVYATADAISIHPAGTLLSHGVTPLDEIPYVPARSDLSGSIMVTDKLRALAPRGWDVETVLSTAPADENHQTAEQYQELLQGGELLPCKDSRGRDDVTAEEAMSVFAQAALGSAGCSDLDVESARLRGSRWVGVQPVGYGEVLSRWYLADAAESMSEGRWGEAAYSAEKYLSVTDTKQQVA
ncbi:Uncharacterised protein [Mycobacteroides abscessus subsp. abscessus]|uniref:hypothetical protein n=1 Tax=Mycobacteroides abscessus TaxID=36809 RepID=UPI0009270ACC|nr:hypothetical protein [Mycobacteroides abscessus]SII09603.1 Uncharacterised protein [Mycobacteroides abscessus subsp. abscessus]SLH24422.1 Uncharacterised protein [Mycobacteroides abscessus subsp. abscessus]